jgi:putative redox protein
MQKQVEFQNAAGETLAATLHLPEKPSRRGVVIGHCFTCSRHISILRLLGSGLAEAGFSALRFDFSGNGQSQGEFARSTYTKQIGEVKTAMAYLGRQGVDWIGLLGHSMGAVVAMLTAAAAPEVRGVCALAGRLAGMTPAHFLSPNLRAELETRGRVSFVSRGRTLELTDGFFGDADRYDLPAAVASLQVPLLVVHGDQDEIVPVAEAYRARDLNPEGAQLAVIPGADHMFSQEAHRQKIAGLVVGWFARLAAPAAA